MDYAEVIANSIEQCRMQGCTCNVEVDMLEVFPGVYIAQAAHDDWCPLVQLGPGSQN